MDNEIIDLLDSDEETFVAHERPDNKLSVLTGNLEDKIETYNISKAIKLEKISEELAHTKEIYFEYSDNEDYDDNFETNDLIEYENFDNVTDVQSESAQLDEDIIFIEDITPNNHGSDFLKTSEVCNFIIPAEQIKKEDITSLAENPVTTKSPVNEATIPLPDHKENDYTESANDALCIITEVYTEPEEYLDSPSKSPVAKHTKNENAKNSINDFCSISPVVIKEGVEHLESPLKSPIIEKCPDLAQHKNDEAESAVGIVKEVENLKSASNSLIIKESSFSPQLHEYDNTENSNNDIRLISSMDREKTVEVLQSPPKSPIIEESPYSPQHHKNDDAESAEGIVKEVENLKSASNSLIIKESSFSPQLHEYDNTESSNNDIRLTSSMDTEKIVEILQSPPKSPIIEESPYSPQHHKNDDAESAVGIVKEVENLKSASNSLIIEESSFSPQLHEDDKAESSNNDIDLISSMDIDKEMEKLESPPKSPIIGESPNSPQQHKNDDAESAVGIVKEGKNLKSASNSLIIEESPFSLQLHEYDKADSSSNDIRLIRMDTEKEVVNLESLPKSPIIEESPDLPQQHKNDEAESAVGIVKEVENLKSASSSLIIERSFSPKPHEDDEAESSNNDIRLISSMDTEKEVVNLESPSKSPIIEESLASPQQHKNDEAENAVGTVNEVEIMKSASNSLTIESSFSPQLHDDANAESSNNDIRLISSMDIEKEVENLKSPPMSPIIEASPVSPQQYINDEAESAVVIVDEVENSKFASNLLIIETSSFSPQLHEDDKAESTNNDIRLISSMDTEKEVVNLESPSKSPIIEESLASPQQHTNDEAESAVDIVKEVEIMKPASNSLIIESSFSPQLHDDDNAESSNNDIRLISSMDIEEVKNLESPSKSPIIEESPASPQQHKNDEAESAVGIVKEVEILKFTSNSIIIKESSFSPQLHEYDKSESSNNDIRLISSMDIEKEVENLNFPLNKSPTIEESSFSSQDEADISSTDIRLISSVDLEKEVENLGFPLKSPIIEESSFSSQIDEAENSNNDIRLISSIDIEKEVENLEFLLNLPIIEAVPPKDHEIDEAISSNNKTSLTSLVDIEKEVEDMKLLAANPSSCSLKTPINKTSNSLPEHKENDTESANNAICIISTVYAEPEKLDSPSKLPVTSESISSPPHTENKNVESSSPVDIEKEVEKSESPLKSSIIQESPTSPQDQVNDEAGNSSNDFLGKPEDNLESPSTSEDCVPSPQQRENGNCESFVDLDMLASPKENCNNASLKIATNVVEEGTLGLINGKSPSFAEEDSNLLASPKENGENATSILEEIVLILDSNKKNYAKSFVEGDLLPEESSKNKSIENAARIVEEDLLLLESVDEIGKFESLENVTSCVNKDSFNQNGEDKSSKIATILVEEDSLPLKSLEEKSEPYTSKTAISSVEEDLLLLDSHRGGDESPKATSLVEEDAASLEDSLPFKSLEEKSEAYTSKTAISCDEEDLLLLDSPRDGSSNDTNIVEEDLLFLELSIEGDESPPDAASLEDPLPLESLKENSEAYTPKTAISSVEEDLLLLDSPRGRDESSKDATSLVEEDSLSLDHSRVQDESLKEAASLEDSLPLKSLEEKNEAYTSKTAISCHEEDFLLLDSSRYGDESSKDATSLIEERRKEDSLFLDHSRGGDESAKVAASLEDLLSLKKKSKASSTKTSRSCVEEDSLLLHSPRDGDEISKNAVSIAEGDSLPFEPPKEAYVSKTAAIWVKENSMLFYSPKSESSKNATSLVEQDSLLFEKTSEAPKTATSCVEEDSLLLDTRGGAKNATRPVEEDEDAVLMESSKENRDANGLQKATSCFEEDSLPLELDNGPNEILKVAKENSLQSPEENISRDESSSNGPKLGTEEGQSNLNLEKNKNSDTLEKYTFKDQTGINNGASTSAINNDCDDTYLDVRVDNEENNETFTQTEEIRNNIRMQLTNLRKGKNNFDFFKDVQRNRSLIDKTEKEVNKTPLFRPTIPTLNKPEIVKPKETKKVESQEDAKVSNAISELRKIINKPKTQKETDANEITSEKEENLTNEPVKTKVAPRPNNISYTVTEIRKIIGTLNTKTNTDIEETNADDKLDSEANDNSNPFVSNTLDEFLTDAKLNVSYDIPKSAAEEGIRKDSYALDPVMLVDTQTAKEEEKDEKDSKKIAKGIASYKPKTLAEKRRILERNKLKLQKQAKNLKVKEELDTRSYVMFKNKKVFLRSKYQSKCLAYFESDVPKQELQCLKVGNEKPSLLKELYRKTSPVKYRPGPLSKKHTLQSDYSQWTTELKPLPKVTLSIMPQFKKPVHPNLIRIVNNQWDAEVSEDQVEFALSALKTEKPTKNIFKFDLIYENKQEQLLVRKKLPDEKPVFTLTVGNTNESVNHEDDDKVVAQVMENLLNYVEIKEIAPTLIKDDEDLDKDDQNLLKRKSINHRKFKRKSRTNRELLRLNCKVVTMGEHQQDDSRGECSKSHCLLGCLCSSLKSEHIIGIGKHCQKAKCIFECSCPKRGSEFLTTDTVTKIEDISKKHLAKEEKEFTQTVICTNNRTFVLGMSSKPRRAAKTPKKYSDFFDDDVIEEKFVTKKEHLNPCYVQVDKWDLSSIVPYCWAHHLYNCHCKGTSASLQNKKRKSSSQSEGSKDAEYTTISGRKVRKKSFRHKYVYEEEADVPNPRTNPIAERHLQDRKNRNTDAIFANDFVNNITQSDRLQASTHRDTPADMMMGNDALKVYIIKERNILFKEHQRKQQHTVRMEQQKCKPIQLIKKITTNNRKRRSAETTETATKTSQNQMKLHSKKGKIEEVKSGPIPNQHRFKSSQAEATTTTEVEATTTTEAEETTTTRAEENTITRAEETTTTERKTRVEPVFKGEIICNDSAWLKKMCNNTQQPEDSYARILPWPALLQGFLLKTIHVYCLWDAPLRLILTKDLELKAAKFLDVHEKGEYILKAKLLGKNVGLIRQSETVRDIVKWLITGNINMKYSATALSFLLVEVQPKLFEVRGCCTQKPSAPAKTPQPENNIQPAEENTTMETDSLLEELEESTQSELTEIKHKNMYNQVMSLFITRNKFKSRELIEDGCDDDLSDTLYMWVELPEVCKVAKWRVIFLKNDFMYLHFKTVKYSIKYTDIVKLTEIAKDYRSTLMVRNLEIRRCHGHPLYGLHFSPKYQDRFFVGPYAIDFMEEDIETLVYRNQSLVSNSSLRSGDDSEKCGAWMYERDGAKVADIVDLTEDDGPSCSSTNTAVTPEIRLVRQTELPDNIMFYSGTVVKVISSESRTSSEFNRFIITNIPHFGYLGAYQHDSSPVLEVSWHFENKILKFNNADLARDFLQERFIQVLQPIPETFKIQVIVLLNLDLVENKPIDAKFLAGNCICGIFGTLNINEVTDEYCKTKLNMSKQDISGLFLKKDRDFMRSKLSELAKLSCTNKGVGMDQVFRRTKEEINALKEQLIKKKTDIANLEINAKSNMKTVYNLIKDLPTKEKNLETRILNETIRIRRKRRDSSVNAASVIEIVDDDAVNVPSTSAVNLNMPSTSSVLKTVSTSSQSSLASLYPIRVQNAKSLLKVNRHMNVNTADKPPEASSSADVVWID